MPGNPDLIVLIGPCGIETTLEERTRKLIQVLIGPCGIETLFRFYNFGLLNIVLIGPCGIETCLIIKRLSVLIGPCGIETVSHATTGQTGRVLIGPCGIETREAIISRVEDIEY